MFFIIGSIDGIKWTCFAITSTEWAAYDAVQELGNNIPNTGFSYFEFGEITK